MFLKKHWPDLFTDSWPIKSSKGKNYAINGHKNINWQSIRKKKITCALNLCSIVLNLTGWISFYTTLATIWIQAFFMSCVNWNNYYGDEQRHCNTYQVVELSSVSSWCKWAPYCLNQIIAKAYIEYERNKLEHLEKQAVWFA